MSTKTTIPCCFYPTTTLLLDDDPFFLEMLKFELNDSVSCVTFTSATEAIDHVKSQPYQGQILQRLSGSDSAEFEQDIDTVVTRVNIKRIINEALNPNRFNEISTLVIDYDMPEMNGVAVARELNMPFLKKIMLTGQADNSIAVQAFNEQVIHQFITKGKSCDAVKLMEIITQLQYAYFNDITSLVLNDTSFIDYSSLGCLKDKAFADYFLTFIKEHNIVEYYLVDTSCNFILFDEKANASYLSIKSAQEMDNYYDFALSGDDTGKQILAALEQKTHVPFFLTDEDHMTPPRRWGSYLHPVTQVIGDNEYFVSHIKQHESPSVKLDEVVSYQAYCDELV